MPRTIAIVEDETAIAANYRDALQRQGYRVNCYTSRQAALRGMAEALPDLAVIDVGLGDEIEGGFDLCRELRARAPQLPIVFLTARDSELDEISGLRLGADDYLTKDISLAHLLARIVALFRRVDALCSAAPEHVAEQLQRGPLRLDLERMRASWHDHDLGLTVTELWMLQALVRHPGHVRSRQQLMEAASVVLDDNTITSHIRRIRRKFEQFDASFAAIETVYGMGYRWLECD